MIEAEPTKNEIETDAVVEEVAEYQRGISDGFQSVGESNTNSKSLRIYCFACHRGEYHFNALKGKSYHYLLVGLTFGMALIFGPYRCRCCGYRRMIRYDFLNPRYHFHRWKYAKVKPAPDNSVGALRVEPSNALELDPTPETTSPEPPITGEQSAPKNAASRHSNADPLNGNVSVRSRLEDDAAVTSTDAAPDRDESTSETKRRRRRRRRKLKSVPAVNSIRKAREERMAQEQVDQYVAQPTGDFSIDGLMGSFETTESRKVRQEELARKRAKERDPFIGRKPKPSRRKSRGKPKRRYAKKERLHGPVLYCFNCKQEIEHFHFFAGTGYYFFLFGITFGLIALVGPYRCSICNKNRFWRSNQLNPKYYFRRLLARGGGGYDS